jgi:hypothetical protein
MYCLIVLPLHIFPYFGYIFCGPSQSFICLIYYFNWFSVSKFKGLHAFYVWNFGPYIRFLSNFSAEGNSFACSNSNSTLHSTRSSFAQHTMQCGCLCPVSVHPLHWLEVVIVCSLCIVFKCHSFFGSDFEVMYGHGMALERSQWKMKKWKLFRGWKIIQLGHKMKLQSIWRCHHHQVM